MRARRRFIHICLCYRSWSSTEFHQFKDLLRLYNSPLWYSFNINSFFRVFSYLKIFLLIPKEIANIFIVNLYIRSSYHESNFLIFTSFDIGKNIFNCSWNNSSTLISQAIFESFHSVCFSCTCLPISKDSSVVPF